MADLTPGCTDCADRGQIILIAAFALAVTFIALALVVNSAIFTENLASRGSTTGASDALEYRHEVEMSVASIVAYVNDNNATASDLPALAADSIENVSAQGGIQHAESGDIVSVTHTGPDTVRAQFDNNGTADFTNTSGQTEWVPATDATGVRSFTFNVTDVSASTQNHSFHYYVNDTTSGDSWEMIVSNSSNDTEITVDSTTGSPVTDTFSRPTNISVPGPNGTGTVNGANFSGLTDSNRTYTGFSGAEIRFTNGNNVTGNYSVTVENADVNDEHFDASSSPVFRKWIHELQVEYLYESADIRYETLITVRPGETDD